MKLTALRSWTLPLVWLLTALLAAEIALRLTGYASPVLYVADADYEYFPAPNQRTQRLGTRLETNSLGMRSPRLAEDSRARVLVLGDSVVSGINWRDQRRLATTLLATRGYQVLNVSAGSWGPGNMLAYVERHGMFGAQHIIVVLSAHDYYDDRSFGPLNAYATPTRAPRSALARAFDHYVLDGPAREARRTARPGAEGDAERALPALFALLQESGAELCVVRHRSRAEIAGAPAPGAAEILALAQTHGAHVVDTLTFYQEAGEGIFSGDIHLTAEGEAELAAVMRACLVTAPQP